MRNIARVRNLLLVLACAGTISSMDVLQSAQPLPLSTYPHNLPFPVFVMRGTGLFETSYPFVNSSTENEYLGRYFEMMFVPEFSSVYDGFSEAFPEGTITVTVSGRATDEDSYNDMYLSSSLGGDPPSVSASQTGTTTVFQSPVGPNITDIQFQLNFESGPLLMPGESVPFNISVQFDPLPPPPPPPELTPEQIAINQALAARYKKKIKIFKKKFKKTKNKKYKKRIKQFGKRVVALGVRG